MKKSLLLFTLLSLSITSFAQTVPKKAFYGGLGASFCLVKFSGADANTLGLSDAYVNGVLVSSGFAGGPYVFPESSENRFAATAQVGYFQHFKNSSWLWGSKFNYSYIGSTATSSNLDIPQSGANTTGQPFTGVAVVQSFEYSANHQMTLTPFIGTSINKAFFYLGVGPSLTETEEHINEVVGYAFLNNIEVNISGEPINFSSTNWVWGIAALAGGTYFFNNSLFLDFSYTFNPTQTQTNNFMAHFSNASGPYSTSGEMIGNTSASETTNSFTLTLNKTF